MGKTITQARIPPVVLPKKNRGAGVWFTVGHRTEVWMEFQYLFPPERTYRTSGVVYGCLHRICSRIALPMEHQHGFRTYPGVSIREPCFGFLDQ